MRTPRDLSEMEQWLPAAREQLIEILRVLERHYGDMQDTEFTVEEGRLYMLQTRNGEAARPSGGSVRHRRGTRGSFDQGRGDRHDRPVDVGHLAAPRL